ncbi:cysteine--tRNA ligase [Apilactobacillus kunkeei]|uniref:Cysteine--tRNA ligase n=1 Tax=Apilactobacillus waqarii TaxID=2851006 RepID=A0ABS6M5I0_9LACO|nr:MULTISPECIES: cysteine--tRNA ligase [Apilactobacillus]MBI0091450.1 cysteine--tRNA ligase [Lactobacillus sp. M0345]KOY75135.1 Cysteine--tRNA ligase [Apilactobacillus kunkeei]MBV0915092.1 cysteine--tRNA ligase [Apilactobacillus waqarii]MCK8619122.1 cysteine--tRNA ligase [Apilactobacillus kunkeei]MCX0325537.1 cysteine--tRNA ligase [Apilactobacillus kunkeei]
MLRIYNTLTQEKDVFKPIKSRTVGMYVCGPTVYNYIHIGNARSIVAFDTIRRYFEYCGYQVNYISNFTDVDDKLINEAKEENSTVMDIANKYIEAYKEDVAALNVEPATVNPRATDNIDGIIQFVKELVDDGYAYAVDGDVYYRARKFNDYGHLSHQSVDDLESGASQHVSEEELSKKEDPIDFVLWKSAKPGEISWDSPWGKGRPGWHIECSVMSTKYLGNTIDIHGGGEDLKFPHHENERAQSEAKTGEKFVNYWMHNGFVTVGDENEKMSKSLGNFVTVHDIVKKVDPQVVRFLMSTTQYRRPIQYNETNLQAAENNLNKLRNAYNNLKYRLSDATDIIDMKLEQEIRQIQADFQDAMDDDFNAQNGIDCVYELAKLGNMYAQRPEVGKDTVNLIIEKLEKMASIFGVVFKEETLDDDSVQALIDERNEARKNKDFARSDEIRDQLRDQGIILEDTAQGTRFRRE